MLPSRTRPTRSPPAVVDKYVTQRIRIILSTMTLQPMNSGRSRLLVESRFIALAVVAPVALTVVLLQTGVQGLEYVFLYMGVVAMIAVLRGLVPALVAAAVSFLLVDYFFILPLHTFTIANRQDVINLLVFFGTAGVVGALASIRRQALLRAEALTRQLTDANAELVRLNREQAEAAQYEIRLARTEQQVKALQESEKTQQEMLANVSHDLRTPIGTILTASTNLLRGDGLAADKRDRLETIVAEARRLNTLVTDTLDLARIEADALQLDLEPLQLSDAISAAVERLKGAPPRELSIGTWRPPGSWSWRIGPGWARSSTTSSATPTASAALARPLGSKSIASRKGW